MYNHPGRMTTKSWCICLASHRTKLLLREQRELHFIYGNDVLYKPLSTTQPQWRVTCGPQMGKQICAPTSLHFHRATNILRSHVRICTGSHWTLTDDIFAAISNSTIFPANPVWIRDHIHHHFLWRVFPVAKGFEINLKQKNGKYHGHCCTLRKRHTTWMVQFCSR